MKYTMFLEKPLTYSIQNQKHTRKEKVKIRYLQYISQLFTLLPHWSVKNSTVSSDAEGAKLTQMLVTFQQIN